MPVKVVVTAINVLDSKWTGVPKNGAANFDLISDDASPIYFISQVNIPFEDASSEESAVRQCLTKLQILAEDIKAGAGAAMTNPT